MTQISGDVAIGKPSSEPANSAIYARSFDMNSQVIVLVIAYLIAIALGLFVSEGAWSDRPAPIMQYWIIATVCGALILSPPLFLAFTPSDKVQANRVCAASLVFMSLLLISLTRGQLQMHYATYFALLVSFTRFDQIALTTAYCTLLATTALVSFVAPFVFDALYPSHAALINHLGCTSIEFFYLCTFARLNKNLVGKNAAEQNERTTVLRAKIEEKKLAQSELAAQAKQIRRVVQVLTSSGERITEVLKELSANAQETLVAVVETTSASEEVTQTAEISMEKAGSVSRDSQSFLRIAERGQSSTMQAVESITKVREQMLSIKRSMLHLDNQSKTIGEIISTVDDLAQQTKLLAVNASIAAVKAGEHGKGFAVVAQEIKHLSLQSTEATRSVRESLGEISTAAEQATLNTELCQQAVAESEDVISQASDSITVLAEKVRLSAQAAERIEVSNQQQLVGMQQVVQAMAELSSVGNRAVNRVKDVEQSVSELNALAQELNVLLGVAPE